MDAEELCPDCGDLLPVCDCVIAWGVGAPGRDRARDLRDHPDEEAQS